MHKKGMTVGQLKHILNDYADNVEVVVDAGEMVRCSHCDEINWVDFKPPEPDSIAILDANCRFCKRLFKFKALTRVYCATILEVGNNEEESNETQDN